MTSARTYGLQLGTAIALVVASMWAATQWAAAALGYQPALGGAWLEVLGLRIYAPWQLFAWWLAFEAQAPDVFARAGVIAASGGLACGVVAIGGAARRTGRKVQPTTYGSARWADIADVRAAKLLGDRGIVLGVYDNRYLRHDGPEHVLAVAPTRSGKGVGLVLPTLLTWPGSAVIHDIKGENWTLTAGWRARFSYCLLFDPTNPLSARFNPLLEVRKGTHEVRDVQNIADILVDPEGAKERRDHWEKTAHALLTGAILHVLYAEQEKTLARVATFLADPSRSILRTLKIMLTTNHHGTEEAPLAHPVVASIARELLNKSDNERSGVVSTAMSFLGLYRDPLIAANTARSDWRIADLMTAQRPVSLYLVVPPSDISRTKPLVRLILNQIARRLTETLQVANDNTPQRQLLLMLDEFPALGRLDFFESSLAFMAGYGIRALLVAQSLHQIDRAYGQYHAILDNCHVRVAFAPNDERTAKRLSDALGTATELRAQRNLSGRRLSAWLSHTSISEQETPRPLLTPGEVLQLAPDDALVLVSGVPPIRACKLRYYVDRNFLARCLPAPMLGTDRCLDVPTARGDDWSGQVRSMDARLDKPWSELVTSGDSEETRPLSRTIPRRKKDKEERPLNDLPLFAASLAEPTVEEDAPPGETLDKVIQFPGLRL
ncbi:MAG: IncP-type conjugal transfer protein TraG [Hyphomonadaceae bacterium]|nr:IncP-type conjugal transfer protein TraG [Hyphomonadaceae bacterium]